jgi:hypothetical protein
MREDKIRVSKLIPFAIEIIKGEEFHIKDQNGNISRLLETTKPAALGGYISQFIVNCVQMTPLAAAMFYTNSQGSEENREVVLTWIYKLLKREDENFTTKTNLAEYIISNSPNGLLAQPALMNIIIAASALKLGFKKFTQYDSKS